MAVEILHGDCRDVMAAMKAAGRTFDAICTDPPYEIGMMGKAWDRTGIAFRPDTWRLALDLLEPGGMMACFGGARTQHRMACAIEDAGFEIRDVCMWLYGSGWPKSRALLKPAYEPVILARKPGPLRPLAIDACRVATDESTARPSGINQGVYGADNRRGMVRGGDAGRWPSNLLHDGSDEVLDLFAAFGTSRSPPVGSTCRNNGSRTQSYSKNYGATETPNGYGDSGTPARFFYAAKASKAERQGSTHPTVKPLSLMRWLVRLITPPGGTVLDMFSGSGTTGVACQREGFDCVLVEREAEYVEMIKARLGANFQLEAAD